MYIFHLSMQLDNNMPLVEPCTFIIITPILIKVFPPPYKGLLAHSKKKSVL